MGQEELLKELEELQRLLREVKEDKKFRPPLPIDRAIEKVKELIRRIQEGR